MGSRMRVVLVAVAVALGASACGGGGDDAVEQAIEDATGGSVDVNVDGTNVEIVTEDGSYSAGGSAEVPDDFPSEIPVPEDLDLTSVYSDDTGWYLTFEAVDLPSDYCEGLLARYVDAGLTEDSRFESTGDITGIFSTDQYSVSVGCTPSLEIVGVTVQDNAAG